VTATPRRHRDPERRAELLAAASRRFASTPFDAVTMDDIAAEAGVAKGLLFYYFGSKRGCYLAVIEDFHRQLITEADLHADLPPSELFPHLLNRYLDFAENAEPAYRLIMSGGLGNDPHVRAFIAEQRARHRAMFTRLLLADRPEPYALRVALEGFLSFLEGATLDWLSHRGISRAALQDLLLTVAPVVPTAALAADPTMDLDPRAAGLWGASAARPPDRIS